MIGFISLQMACPKNAFADDIKLLEDKEKIEYALNLLKHSCQGLEVDLRAKIVAAARDAIDAKCDKGSDCIKIPVNWEFKFFVSQAKDKTEPVLANDKGETVTLEQLVKSKVGKDCQEPIKNIYHGTDFYTFGAVKDVKADEDLVATMSEIANARGLLNPHESLDRAQVAVGSGVKTLVTPIGDRSPDQPSSQGQSISPRNGQNTILRNHIAD